MIKSQLPAYRKLLIGFLLIYLLRLLIVATMGIMPQDAYYYLYSEHLALSYFDHPPMVAYMLKLFSLVLGKSVLAIKLTDFIVTLLTVLAFFRLARIFLSDNQAIKAALFFGTTLMVSILSINTTPDVPLLLFWTLSLIFAHKALFENRLWHWMVTGLMFGFAFISKYTGIFLLFGLFAFMLFSPRHRRYLISKESLLVLLFFGLAIFPVVYWNQSNGWISFAFQTSERAESLDGFKLQPLLFLGNLGTQLFLLIPFLFVGMVIVIFKLIRKFARKRTLPGERQLYLMAFSLPIIFFFFGISIIYWVKLNWIMPGYVTAIILVAPYLSAKILRGQVITSLVLHLLLAVQVVFYPVNIKSDDTWFGWEEFSVEADRLMSDHPGAFLFSDDNYKTSAVLSFYLDRKIYAGNVIGRNGKQFYLLDPDLEHLRGSDAIFIDTDKRIKSPGKSNKVPEKLSGYFDRVEELDPILIGKEDGKPLRKFLVYKCYDYKVEPPKN